MLLHMWTTASIRYSDITRLFRVPPSTPKIFRLQVTLCLYALARTTQKHSDYTGPRIGPKMAEKNERNFTDEQIKAGRDSQIGLQAGSNKGASQSGHGGMGNTRHM